MKKKQKVDLLLYIMNNKKHSFVDLKLVVTHQTDRISTNSKKFTFSVYYS